MTNEKKPSIFKKALEASEAWLDTQINKSKSDTMSKELKEEDDFYAKTIVNDPNYKINSQGYKSKAGRLLDEHLKQMSLKNSVVAAIIQTQQNKVASYSKLVDSDKERGWRIKLKDEKSFLAKVKEEIEAEDSKETENQTEEASELASNNADSKEKYDWELERKARDRMVEDIADRIKRVEDFISNCGSMDNRPFESKKWNFDTYLRAITRDRLTYDRICTEVVPDNKNDPHHFFAVDACTIRLATPDLKHYKKFPAATMGLDFLYPEKQVEALTNDRDAIELDEALLEADKYKYAQVIKGQLERAYTADEMKVGMANVTTDIYSNGYSIAELELLVGLVSSHLNAEFYNMAYYTQGFSAKGILHIKAPINRRKLESVRQQWQHTVKGSRNSFQTPIFAGVDDVNWIPLTQNHSDIEFQGWMNYLIKMICAIYQIDPQEIGYGIKEEGGKGGGLGGDNTKEKLENSKDKGLKPLLRFFESYINSSIVDMIDSELVFEFVGIDNETIQEALVRQEKEAKFKKTLNEIRSEDNLPPLPGGDNIILGTEYMQWYMQFSEEAKGAQKEAQQQQQDMMAQQQDQGSDMSQDGQWDDSEDNFTPNLDHPSLANIDDALNNVEKSLKKSEKKYNKVSIEVYKLEK